MPNYHPGANQWTDWLNEFSNKEDRNEYKFIVSYTMSGSSGAGLSFDNLEKLEEFVISKDIPVVIPFLPHITVLPIRKDGKDW